MSKPLDERHCRAEMRPGSGIFCGRHKGHEKEPGDTGHRQDPPHPATLQPDICDRLTPATVIAWLMDRAREQASDDATLSRQLAMASVWVEKLIK